MMIPSFTLTARTRVDNAPVPYVELAKYLGRWYEIARFDKSFERGIFNTTAIYELRPDGKVRVTNAGWKNGLQVSSEGVAFRPDPERQPGWMRVSFFRPFYSDYRILMVDDEYSYALVGSGSNRYLWILSRDPVLEGKKLDKVLFEAEARGYDTDKLLWIDQSRNEKR